ncbi:hypothetical protein VP1G_03074 [Cytospora mali]|uniref:Uncharacterized protein n=1 Tax=Cytospora mali TaxID=578113 RepID=A0A194UV93_CYTMA|nr:hypothetical protein VP1G_03074 [Valsa mali var. pyri (nom. inval.)]
MGSRRKANHRPMKKVLRQNRETQHATSADVTPSEQRAPDDEERLDDEEELHRPYKPHLPQYNSYGAGAPQQPRQVEYFTLRIQVK